MGENWNRATGQRIKSITVSAHYVQIELESGDTLCADACLAARKGGYESLIDFDLTRAPDTPPEGSVTRADATEEEGA